MINLALSQRGRMSQHMQINKFSPPHRVYDRNHMILLDAEKFSDKIQNSLDDKSPRESEDSSCRRLSKYSPVFIFAGHQSYILLSVHIPDIKKELCKLKQNKTKIKQHKNTSNMLLFLRLRYHLEL